jgi:hypothetical protein
MVRTTLALLALAVPGFASAGSCPGGTLVASGSVTLDPADPYAGLSIDGIPLVWKGVEPDEIDFDSALKGVEPDEIDFASALCLSGDAAGGSVVTVTDLEVFGVEPDEIDDEYLATLTAGTPVAQTREHVLLARQVGVPAAALPASTAPSEVTTTGHAVLRLDAVRLEEQIVTSRPLTTRTVATLTYTVIDLISVDGSEPLTVYIETDTALYPELPICAHCAAD